MAHSGYQCKQIQDALVAAFGNEDNLRVMLWHQMSVNLDSIAKPNNLIQRTFDVVTWADQHGKIGELIRGACAQYPGNSELLVVAEAVKRWRIETAGPAEIAPYKGLAFYGVADASIFFGREKLTTELVAYLKDHYFLAVVGASGSGKSSVVQAGVVPALKKGELIKSSEDWQVAIVKPTATPLLSLATKVIKGDISPQAATEFADGMASDARILKAYLLQCASDRVLVIIDQFEELFTLCKDKNERKAFIDNLLTAAIPDGAATVVLTLRSDFYVHCAEYDNLRAALSHDQVYIGAMKNDELRSAIEEPARQGGWELEPGLANLILNDMSREPGALPLLSHALLQTWERRSGSTLTFAGYHDAGGVQGAIAKTADSVYVGLTTEEKMVARSIFLRLTELGEGTQDTRRRVPMTELASLPAVEMVLQKLETARLVTADSEGQEATFVDVTHEALIREWNQLRQWLVTERDWLLVHRRLTEAAQRWKSFARDPGALYRGALLAQTREKAMAHDSDLNDLEREFLDASQAQVDAEQSERARIQLEREDAQKRALADAEALAEEQRRRAAEHATASRRLQQRNRGLIAALIAALAAFVLAGIFFWQAQVRADLADAKLHDLEGERLVTQARRLRAELNVADAIRSFEAAYTINPTLFVLSDEISETVRYVATAYVREGEKIMCTAFYDKLEKCQAPVPSQAVEPITTNVAIDPMYLAWAQAVAPQVAGWSSYTSTVQQQAVISATALYSQALGLNPPPDTPVYVWITPGTFNMGSTDEQCERAGIGNCPPDEQPRHSVELDGYWIQRTEVTNAQYKRCVDAGGCPAKPSNLFWALPRSSRLPVTHIDWNQASAYAAWVGGRLPTEAEWENGCRGGDGRVYPWGDEPPDTERLNYDDDLGGASEVGTYSPGANGLYDMAGNVWEWTADWYSESYYRVSPKHNPTGPQEGEERTLRGGSFYNTEDEGHIRCTFRLGREPNKVIFDFGFRVLSPGL